MFDPLAFPYVRAQTYVDGAAPAVLSNEFYNPVQDAIARLYGGAAGYSTLILYEEFIQPVASTVIPSGIVSLFGQELEMAAPPGWQYGSVDPTGPSQYGVYRIQGVANGNRGGTPGLRLFSLEYPVDTVRWIFRARLRCSNFSPLVTSPPGLVVGTSDWVSGSPVWAASSSGFWIYQWDGGSAVSSIPTVAGQWVTLWIANRDADGKVRWYIKRDFDALPILVDTRTLVNPSLSLTRLLTYQVGGTAVAADNIEVDNMSLIVEC